MADVEITARGHCPKCSFIWYLTRDQLGEYQMAVAACITATIQCPACKDTGRREPNE